MFIGGHNSLIRACCLYEPFDSPSQGEHCGQRNFCRSATSGGRPYRFGGSFTDEFRQFRGGNVAGDMECGNLFRRIYNGL